MKTNNQIYSVVTDRVIKALHKGNVPWKKPWDTYTSSPQNMLSKKAYRGINLLLTSMSEFNNPYWLTFNQIRKLKGTVKKGEKATPIIFWNWIYKDANGKKLKEQEKEKAEISYCVPILYHVFNLEQTKGIKKPINGYNQKDFPITYCEVIIDNMPKQPIIKTGYKKAYYHPAIHQVCVPNKQDFHSIEAFYCTLFHELVHSTGHKQLLNRDELYDSKMFGDHSYSKEELTAEMGASFLSAIAGIDNSHIQQNQQAYIQNWIKVLENDKSLLIQAANRAQKATDFILNNK